MRLESRDTALGGDEIVAGVTWGQRHGDVGLHVPRVEGDVLGGAAVVHRVRANVHRLDLARIQIGAHPLRGAGLRAAQDVLAASGWLACQIQIFLVSIHAVDVATTDARSALEGGAVFNL